MLLITESLAKFIAETDCRDIPQEAYKIAKRCFIDCLGVTVAGSLQPEAKIIRELIRNFGGHQEAGIVASGFKTLSHLAALANGVLAHALDYDDVSTTFLAHPSVNLVPTILALAETHKKSGREALTSYIIGYEVGASLGSVMGMKFFERGWHATSILGSIGAAASASRLLGLRVEQVRSALGIAASLAGGLKINFGSMTKPLHTGNAAQGGVLAAHLASKGFTANESAIDGPNGFCCVYKGDECDFTKIEKTIGRDWSIVFPGIKFKLYPCCGSIHGCADAILALKRNNKIFPRDIVEIECRLSPLMIETGASIHSPKTGQEGKFSLEYNMAIALIDSELSLNQYTDEKVKSGDVQDLMKKVRIVFPVGIQKGMEEPQTVVIKLKDGRQLSLTVEKHKGTIENPITDEEFFYKFRNCASSALKPKNVDEVLDLLVALEEVQETTRLMELLTFNR